MTVMVDDLAQQELVQKLVLYFEKIPKEEENADDSDLNLTHENGIASCVDYFNSS